MYGVTIDHSTVSDNTAGGDGGGLIAIGSPLAAAHKAPLLVQDSTISGNQAAQGAGIMIGSDLTTSMSVTVQASTIRGNAGWRS